MTVFQQWQESIRFTLKVADDVDSRLKRSGVTDRIILCLVYRDSTVALLLGMTDNTYFSMMKSTKNHRLKTAREGIPYQALVSQVIHKYIHDRLHDEEDIIKSIELLRKAGAESTEI